MFLAWQSNSIRSPPFTQKVWLNVSAILPGVKATKLKSETKSRDDDRETNRVLHPSQKRICFAARAKFPGTETVGWELKKEC